MFEWYMIKRRKCSIEQQIWTAYRRYGRHKRIVKFRLRCFICVGSKPEDLCRLHIFHALTLYTIWRTTCMFYLCCWRLSPFIFLSCLTIYNTGHLTRFDQASTRGLDTWIVILLLFSSFLQQSYHVPYMYSLHVNILN